MKNKMKILTTASCTAVLLFASGSVFSQQQLGYKIDTVDSQHVTVSKINLSNTNEGYIIKGEVRNKVKNRTTPIPGHVDVSVVGADGKIINTTPTSIYRISRKARFAKFQQALKVSPVAGSIIRVTHHNAPLGVNTTDLIHK